METDNSFINKTTYTMNAKDKKQRLEIAKGLRSTANLYGRQKLAPEEVKSKITSELGKHELTRENEMFFEYVIGVIGQWSGIPDYSSASLWHVLIDTDVDE